MARYLMDKRLIVYAESRVLKTTCSFNKGHTTPPSDDIFFVWIKESSEHSSGSQVLIDPC